MKRDTLSVLFSADSDGLHSVVGDTEGIPSATLALHPAVRCRRVIHLGICTDVPAQNGKILVEWTELGRRIPRVAGIETRAACALGDLHLYDSHPCADESQDRPY